MGLAGGGIAWTAKILAEISKSITGLHSQIVLIVEKTAWHEKEIEKHEDRLSELEKRK